ncbi:glycosyl transferase family 1 [Clostridia bacterium]|nr:glycosyl transferase family 1 [Clostridia bacterium]
MKVMVTSLRFNIVHTQHLIAWGQMLTGAGYEAALFVDSGFNKHLEGCGTKIINTFEEAKSFAPDVIVAYSSASKNLKLVKTFKGKAKLFFTLHEPYCGLKDFLIGTAKFIITRAIPRNILDRIVCANVDAVILPSEKAKISYQNHTKHWNKNFTTFPLLFPDLYKTEYNQIKREYFSYIGNWGNRHGKDNYLKTVKYIYDNKLDIKCKIATRYNINEELQEPHLKEMIKSGQLVVFQGRDMTLEEINNHFLQAAAVWLVYTVSQQSGVLGTAFMMGAPAIVSNVGSFKEYVKDGYNGHYINNTEDFAEITEKFNLIKNNAEYFSKNARQTFKDKYSPNSQANRFEKMIEAKY